MSHGEYMGRTRMRRVAISRNPPEDFLEYLRWYRKHLTVEYVDIEERRVGYRCTGCDLFYHKWHQLREPINPLRCPICSLGFEREMKNGERQGKHCGG